jgi:hypothetical protein
MSRVSSREFFGMLNWAAGASPITGGTDLSGAKSSHIKPDHHDPAGNHPCPWCHPSRLDPPYHSHPGYAGPTMSG